jgi:hypothetical protein
VTKICDRQCNNLQVQVLQLHEAKAIREAELMDKVRELEGIQKNHEKERRQFGLDKESLEQQMHVCRGESRRLELRKEDIRQERLKYKSLIHTWRKRIKLAVEKQTNAVEDTTTVSRWRDSFFSFSFLVLFDSLISLLV